MKNMCFWIDSNVHQIILHILQTLSMYRRTHAALLGLALLLLDRKDLEDKKVP